MSEMKKVNLSLVIDAKMIDMAGKVMAPFNFTGGYNDINYDDAVKVEASLMQAIHEHGQRMIAMGIAKAAEMKK